MNDNNTIVINTIVLTIKLVITIVCSFIVSRLILQALGADNYGLYNVVGGIVSMLALISSSMVATSYRYIAVERGKGKSGNPQRVYSTLLLIHLVLGVLLLVIGEPLGAFYIEHYLNVTNASISDAHFVFVLSLIATFFSIIVVPSNGLLIAEEKFIPISVIEVARALLNVIMAVFLLHYFGNRLRLYALLMAILAVGNNVAFILYCRKQYPNIVKFTFNKNKQDYKEIASFAGWMLIGASAYIGRTQGVAMVINLFFRNSINAAFGIANQVGNAAQQFTNTLRQSVTPQIMKNQADNSARSLNLVYAISRYSYLIMLIICVPLLLCMNTILQLWLGAKNIPPLTAVFSSWLLVDGLLTCLRSGFDASIQASGRVRKNQIGYTIINLSIIPIVFILYKIGLPAYMNVVVGVLLCLVTNVFQASIMRELTDFQFSDFWKKTILPSLYATLLAFIPMISLRLLWGESVYAVLVFSVVCIVWACVCVFFVGISKDERVSVIVYINKKIA